MTKPPTGRALLTAVVALNIWTFETSEASAQTPPAPAIQPANQSAGAAPSPSSQRLRVYLDCGSGQSDCFSTYLRDRITFVDFVRQPQDSDVQLLSTGSDTGGGGQELALRFVGRGRFDGRNQELKALTGVSDTEDMRRQVVLRTVIVGLLGYMASDGLPADLSVDVRGQTATPQASPVRDPWNLWVYSIEINGGLEADERNRQREWNLNFSADRVTDEWKLSLGVQLNEDIESFELDDEPGEERFEVVRHEREFDGFAIKALGPHWSAGGELGVDSSTFDNLSLSASVRAAVEYSIFPYREYTNRLYRINYDVGIDRNRYIETTLFGKTAETLWRHQLSAAFDQRAPWGTLEAELEFGQYLHDASKYRLEGQGSINVRIMRGLSVNLSGTASRVRDQITLPLRDATDEEVLLQIRELQSGYELELSFGLTYSFGSIFNNIVNPRFGT